MFKYFRKVSNFILTGKFDEKKLNEVFPEDVVIHEGKEIPKYEIIDLPLDAEIMPVKVTAQLYGNVLGHKTTMSLGTAYINDAGFIYEISNNIFVDDNFINKIDVYHEKSIYKTCPLVDLEKLKQKKGTMIRFKDLFPNTKTRKKTVSGRYLRKK